MPRNNRRVFLGQAAAATASLLCAKDTLLWGMTPGRDAHVRAWVTTADARFKEIEPQRWQTAGGSPDIQIDATNSFQSILGFGAAFTDASCYLLNELPSEERKALLEDLVGADGLRLSMGRTCIGASDYSRNVYSFDESQAPDPALKNFSIAHDEAYILPMLRAAQEINPQMFYFSTPWSPPGWMKAGGSMLGGSMRKKYFGPYADYFVKFLQGYQAAGVKISAVTSQNEVDTDQDGRMPAALWGQEYESGFIKGFLGPALQKSSPDTKIWLHDHNYDLSGRVMDELADPEVYRYVDGVAWHGYAGDVSAMTRVHDAFPAKGTYFTEGGPDISDPNYATNWAKWTSSFARILRNWARCIVSWNLVLDEKGLPNIGPFPCGGVVTVDSKTRQITRSGQYWAFAHYSKAVARGAKVIASQGTVAGMNHAAFANPDGSYVLVIGNEGEERKVVLGFGGKMLNLSVPRDSALTLTWSEA